MLEYRTPNTDGSVEFQTKWGTQDHSTNPIHVERFAHVSSLILDVDADTWTDLGCGQGALLSMTEFDGVKRGFDFWQDAVDAAVSLGRPVELLDFVNEPVPYADLITMTEVLEHLDDPHKLLRDLDCRWLIATVPSLETPEQYDLPHCWVWDEEGFKAMVEGAGYEVSGYSVVGVAQFIVAERRSS